MLVIEIGRELHTKGKGRRKLVELCKQHQIAITKTVAKIKEGWEGSKRLTASSLGKRID